MRKQGCKGVAEGVGSRKKAEGTGEGAAGLGYLCIWPCSSAPEATRALEGQVQDGRHRAARRQRSRGGINLLFFVPPASYGRRVISFEAQDRGASHSQCSLPSCLPSCFLRGSRACRPDECSRLQRCRPPPALCPCSLRPHLAISPPPAEAYTVSSHFLCFKPSPYR